MKTFCLYDILHISILGIIRGSAGKIRKGKTNWKYEADRPKSTEPTVSYLDYKLHSVLLFW